MARVERICTSGPKKCGEGPHWMDRTQSLVMVDVVGQDIIRWDERSQTEHKTHIEGKPDPSNPIGNYTSLVVPVAGAADKYVISRGAALALLQWDGCSSQHSSCHQLVRVEQHAGRNMRFNDGKCDRNGALWAGTMSEETGPGLTIPGTGSLYSFSSRDGSATRRLGGVNLSNGLAWSTDASTMFYIDTSSMKVDAFDYDITNTSISNRRTVYDVAATRTPGLPDGMTIDTQGRLWVAMFFAGRVICVDPESGRLVQEVHLPATNTTSCQFGGPGYDVLYVTSANVGLADWQLAAQPDAGGVFKVTGVGAKGVPSVDWQVDLKGLTSL